MQYLKMKSISNKSKTKYYKICLKDYLKKIQIKGSRLNTQPNTLGSMQKLMKAKNSKLNLHLNLMEFYYKKAQMKLNLKLHQLNI